MELALPKDGKSAQFVKFTKRLRDANVLPIGVAHDNPMLDTRIYEVKYHDCHKASLTAITIAKNLFSQVNEEGNRRILLYCITNHRTNGTEEPIDGAYITSKNSGLRKHQTTNGWEVFLQWKYGSTTWEPFKNMKYCYPLQLAEYVVQNVISSLPDFDWWIPFVIKKKNRIIANIKSKYWIRTHKFRIEISKSVEDAKRIDQANHNTNWLYSICKEMKNVCITFEK